MEKIIDILSELHPDVDFDTCDTLVDDGVLDSMDIVSLINEIYNEFEVRIPAEQIIPENFNSAESIWEMVSNLLDE